ncbi:hypothetical protein [Deinococcus alpinitundrae]|uniref:hypothetical protein n=1 Tax=Deinococcus alpinitundrae TaxID=468913 RepID=UPI00137AB233|nr:hypothetical protein [Deinococcus alpinitundrae]
MLLDNSSLNPASATYLRVFLEVCGSAVWDEGDHLKLVPNEFPRLLYLTRGAVALVLQPFSNEAGFPVSLLQIHPRVLQIFVPDEVEDEQVSCTGELDPDCCCDDAASLTTSAAEQLPLSTARASRAAAFARHRTRGYRCFLGSIAATWRYRCWRF